MEEKFTKEWFLETTWGKVAMISWGERHRPPILLVHGYLDTAATFIPLVRHLPDTYYYVSFDFPGHGKSDHVHSGPSISQTFMLEILRRIVDHMQWESFVYLAHSMGFIQGLFYQHLYPGRIKKMINLDPMLPLTQYYYITHHFNSWFYFFYEYYHDHYHGVQAPKLITQEQAVKAVMKVRSLTQEQAQLLLSRSLIPTEDGLFRLSSQTSMRGIVAYPVYEDLLRYILASSAPPMLNIHATGTRYQESEKEFVTNIFSVVTESKKHLNVHIEEHHDMHFTNPELLVPHILEFLGRNDNVKSNL